MGICCGKPTTPVKKVDTAPRSLPTVPIAPPRPVSKVLPSTGGAYAKKSATKSTSKSTSSYDGGMALYGMTSTQYAAASGGCGASSGQGCSYSSGGHHSSGGGGGGHSGGGGGCGGGGGGGCGGGGGGGC